MKRDPKEIVEFSFMIRTHRPRKFEREFEIEPEPTRELVGEKTLKLFKSWWRLMKNRGKLLYGVVKFKDGETWIWQPKYLNRGGWQLARKSRHKREEERKAKWENFILQTVGLVP